MTHPPPGQDGFTLIEVAAAATIGAAALAALLTVFGDGAIRTDRAGLERVALMLAQSALEGAEADGPLVPGATWGGAAWGMAWRVEVGDWSAPTAANRAATGPGPEPRLLSVTVRGDRGAGPVLARLATIRLTRPPLGALPAESVRRNVAR